MSYVLVYWEEPPSTSIVHKSKVIGGVLIGALRLIVWGKEQIQGKILRVGTMPVLKQIVVTVDGEVSDPSRGPNGEVAKRRRDLLDERQRRAVVHRTAATAARAHFLYGVTADAAQNNDAPAPAALGNYFFFPPNASPEEMLRLVPLPLTKENLREIVRRLPCLREPQAGDESMLNLGGTTYPVYLPSKTVYSVTKNHKGDPNVLFRELLLRCVPPTVLALPWITAAGTANSVGLPRNVLKGVAYYVGTKTDGCIKSPSKSAWNLIRDTKANPSVRAALEKLLRRSVPNHQGAVVHAQATVTAAPPPLQHPGYAEGGDAQGSFTGDITMNLPPGPAATPVEEPWHTLGNAMRALHEQDQHST
ncbi:uncharacterized protein LOC117649410 [Thrips palmi]|uniref:Uncharacterized protein LOC117649410 n=1 Tax=Thrips palmi TaxID=161013 RepID=A0A6P8ZS75_THRPL|nr:uncharacterized protein LOC117649410 [Thrips palmi]